MSTLELLRMFLQAPELSTVGSPQERAAFIALRIEGRTVREAGQAIGVSKSNVANLAGLFQAKLTKRMMEMRRGTATWSTEYRRLNTELLELMPFDDGDWLGGHKVGNFDTGAASQEDWAEMRGTSLREDMDE